MAKQKPDSKEVRALKQEIATLESKIAALEKQTKKSVTQRQKFSWKKLISWFSVALAITILVLGNVMFWASNTILRTDRYTAAVGPIIEQPAVRTAVALYTTTALFNAVDVQAYVQSVLPPRAEVLATPLANQLQSYTRTSLESLLASSKFQDYWYSSLTRRHDALLHISKTYEGNGTIEVSDAFSALARQLSDTRLSFLSNVQLPANIGSIRIATVGWLPVLHKIATHAWLYQATAVFLLIGFIALAIWLSSRRRRMIITLGIFFSVFMLITLVVAKVAGSIIVSKAQPDYQTAIQAVYDTVFHSFRVQTVSLLLVSALASFIAWVSGPYKAASTFRLRLSTLFSGKLHSSVFSNENRVTVWTGAHKSQLQWASVFLVAVIVLLVRVSPRRIILYAIGLMLLILTIEFLAADPVKKTRSRA